MSLISKQINDLRAYAKDRKGELAKLVSDAADTIEELSAKLSAANMERSSQYYHGGWIPIDERAPEVDEDGYSDYVLLSFANASIPCIGQYVVDEEGGAFHDGDDERTLNSYGLIVNAWMPWPKRYRGDEREDD